MTNVSCASTKYWNIREQVCVSRQDCENILNEQITESDTRHVYFVYNFYNTRLYEDYLNARVIVVCRTRFIIKKSLDGNYKFKVF